MLEYITKTKQQFLDFWQSLNKSQKIKIAVGTLLIFAVAFALFFTMTKIEYSILATDLSINDVNEIVKKLDELGIKWKQGPDHSTILVDSKQKSRARLELAMIPNTSFGLIEALNSNGGLGITDEDKRLNWNLGKMKEVEKTLKQNPYIKDAVVILEVPKDNVFVLGQNKKPKASVQLTLEYGKQLDQSQVQGIVNFIAGSVVDLTQENITLIDNAGRQLNVNSSEPNNQLDSRYQIQFDVEKNLQSSIKEFLETIYRPGNVDVRVSVKLDFDSKVTNRTVFAPPIEGEENGLIRTLRELNEYQTNTMGAGPVGVEPNTEPTNYPEIDGSNSRFEKASRDIYYELNEINEQIVKAQGQVEDITVAVVINKEDMEEAERRQIENLVRNSSGVRTKSVVVMNTVFGADDVIRYTTASAPGLIDQILNNMPLLLGAILIIGALITTLFMTLRKKKTSVDKLMEQAAITKETAALQDIDLSGDEKSQVKKQIENFVNKKPDAVAQLLKSWLSEE